MYPQGKFVETWHPSGKFYILDEWNYYPSKRTDAQREIIQRRWNDRLKKRLHKEVGNSGSSGVVRKM